MITAIKDRKSTDAPEMTPHTKSLNIIHNFFLKLIIAIREVTSQQILGGQIGKKSLICLEGKSMTPHRETLFSSVPPSNFLVSDPLKGFLSQHGALLGPSPHLSFAYKDREPRTLEGLFELTRHPSRALDSPHALFTQRSYRKRRTYHQVCCARWA